MTGLKITLPQAFTDTSLPLLRDDPLLTDGSLLLVDPAHPANPMPAGLPASGAAIPNLAWKEAATILGTSSPTKDSLPSLFTYGNGFGAAGSKGVVERTAKGGLHGIVSQAQSLVSGDGASLTLDSTLRTYLAANKNHTFFMSLWGNVTRADPGPTVPAEMASLGMTNSTTNVILMIQNNGGQTPAFPPLGSAPTPAVAVTGQFLAAIAAASPTGTPTAQGRAVWGAPAGGYNAAILASRNAHWPSWVLYRMYLEDLTVSGRTYAQVKALSDAAYASAFAAGGRYSGDTFTSPATLL